MSTAMKPTAEGNFQKTPFANVLLYARDRKMTGSIVVTIHPSDPEQFASLDVAGISTLVLESGSIVALQTPSQTETLGWVLHEQGTISEDIFVQVQDALTRLGADEVSTLLRLRAADTVSIQYGLRELARRKTIALFGLPQGNYAYYANVDLLAGSGRLRTAEDVLPIVWRGFVAQPPEESAIHGVIEKLGKRLLKLKDGHELDAFEFGEELGLAPTQLRTAPSGIEQLMGLAPQPSMVRSMIYLLALTKQVEVAPTQPPAAAVQNVAPPMPPRPPPVPQGGAKPPPVPKAMPAPVAAPQPATAEPVVASEPHPKLKEGQQLLAQLEHKNYFEMFDLANDASPDDVRTAFPKTVAPWHPDKAPVPELRSLYEEIFGVYNSAFATLNNKESRSHYEQSLGGGGGTIAAQKKVAAVLDTVQDVHRAEIAFKRKDYVEAERLLRRVLAATDDDISALLALAQCLLEVDPVRYADEVIGHAAKVFKCAEGNDRARLYMGQALKAKGDIPRARACFKQALELNPQNIEALRELRLVEMRLQQRRDEKAQQSSIGGLLNKFLKK
jgi:tetratricopeptide (TPR) repeat protein